MDPPHDPGQSISNFSLLEGNIPQFDFVVLEMNPGLDQCLSNELYPPTPFLCFEKGSSYVAQVGLEHPGSNDSPASISTVHTTAHPNLLFFLGGDGYWRFNSGALNH